MHPRTILIDTLMAVADQPVALVVAIVIATFVLEDIATITVALLASHMIIDGPIAIGGLVAGTILGDLAVYYVARRAAHLPWVARLMGGKKLKPVLGWLERHALPMIVIARFTPGLRLPVFAGAGSLGVPASTFTVVVALSTLVWTPGLYWTAITLGTAGLERLGMFGWVLPALFIAAMAMAPRLVSTLIARRPAFALVPA